MDPICDGCARNICVLYKRLDQHSPADSNMYSRNDELNGSSREEKPAYSSICPLPVQDVHARTIYDDVDSI